MGEGVTGPRCSMGDGGGVIGWGRRDSRGIVVDIDGVCQEPNTWDM